MKKKDGNGKLDKISNKRRKKKQKTKKILDKLKIDKSGGSKKN